MLTTSTAKSQLLSETKVPSSDTTNTTLLMKLWNESRRTVAGINGGKWPWLEIEEEVDTVADQDYVEIPNHIEKVISVRQQNGSNPTDVIYRPRMIFSQDAWDTLLQTLIGPSSVPYNCYQKDQKLYIFPTPDTSGNRVIMRGRIKLRDNDIDDYSTGSVVSIANGAKAVVGTGTTWTTSMAGRYIRITESDTANKGDGYWYKIASVGSATTLTLQKEYQGTSITAGTAAYTIGQITYEPEIYQAATIYRTVARFFQINDPLHPDRYNYYWNLYDGGVEAGTSERYGGMIGQMLEQANESMEGNYMAPLPRDGAPNNQSLPYYNPWQQASGF